MVWGLGVGESALFLRKRPLSAVALPAASPPCPSLLLSARPPKIPASLLYFTQALPKELWALAPAPKIPANLLYFTQALPKELWALAPARYKGPPPALDLCVPPLLLDERGLLLWLTCL